MALFDAIGGTYNQTRSADGRIVDELVRLLGLPEGAVIADIGGVDVATFPLPHDLSDNFKVSA